MTVLTYVVGDATIPQGPDARVIVHCCNNIGRWGAGFVVALGNRWPKAREAYLQWFSEGFDQPTSTVLASSPTPDLGEVQFVLVAPKLWVANLIGQRGIGYGHDRKPPIRYEAIEAGLRKVAHHAKTHQASTHMPKLGSGLAGGDWHTVEGLINQELVAHGVRAVVYTPGSVLPSSPVNEIPKP